MLQLQFIMNQDERFQQRWEFRSSKVDGGTSSDDDDEGSNPGGEPTDKKHNAVTALVLYENDDQGSQKHDDNKPSGISSKASKADEEKKKPSKKKEVVQKKKGAVKETKRKRKHSINDKAMFKDLKVFAESLIHELAAARESMFADMRDEMRKLTASRPNKGLVKTNVRRPEGNVACDTRAEAGKQAQGLDLSRANHELQKDDRVRLSAMVNMNHLINGHIPSMDNNNSGSGIDICRLMAARSLSRRLAEFQPQEQLGGFALNYHKNWGLYGETRPYTSHGVGFPVPVHQGTDIYFNRSSMSFMDGMGVNARFASSSGASLGGMVPKGIVGSTPAPRKSDGEFERSQGKKDARFNHPTNKG